jgi:hydroxymethylbilane synthase
LNHQLVGRLGNPSCGPFPTTMTEPSPTNAPHRIRLGTRASALARWQAEWVAARLRELGIEVLLVPIFTSGDRQQERPIGSLPNRGVFTKELQRALLEDRIDLAVHSLKDLPTDPVAGLCLAAIPPRASTSDVLVAPKYDRLDALPAGAVVGTGSLRRRAQLLRVRPDLRMGDVRGNVETRLRKLDQGDFDALVLAEAGLERLGLAARITHVLPPAITLPAVGQGALALETKEDAAAREVARRLNHPESESAVLAERAMLAALQGGCLAPIAAWGRIEGGQLALAGRVLSPDGRRMVETAMAGDPSLPEDLGRRVADALLAQGAAELVEEGRGQQYGG